jgi:hypothetical protein
MNEKEITALIIFGVVSFLWCAFCIILESIIWRKGYCKCGNPWEHFDTDSQGGEGFVCSKCDKTIWISWISSFVKEIKK